MGRTIKKALKLSASQKVEAHIRRAIYEGRLKPRERIIEDDIARQQGCSRGPVREAVLRLERDGLIVTTSRHGTFIRDFSPEEIEVVFNMRGKLEALAVHYMRERMTAETQAALEKCLDDMKMAAAKLDDEQFLQADMALHSTIWKLSGEPPLHRTLSLIMTPFLFMVARAYTSRSFESLEDAFKDHERYVHTILTTPLAKVEREVEKYFRGLFKVLDNQVFRRHAASIVPTGRRQRVNEVPNPV